MTNYRCDWCGRFYASPLPEGSACPNHILEHNERLGKSIERHNSRIAKPESERERDADDGRTYADPRDERDERARR